MDRLYRVLKALLVVILSFYKDQKFLEGLICLAISPQYHKDGTISDKTCQRETFTPQHFLWESAPNTVVLTNMNSRPLSFPEMILWQSFTPGLL